MTLQTPIASWVSQSLLHSTPEPTSPCGCDARCGGRLSVHLHPRPAPMATHPPTGPPNHTTPPPTPTPVPRPALAHELPCPALPSLLCRALQTA
jgi:hypothetical protein